MAKFYFTYGLEGQPFVGGWTEVEAPDTKTACAIFRVFHPDKYEGILNCADYYTEEQFLKTQMAGPGGNLGCRCHERITVQFMKPQIAGPGGNLGRQCYDGITITRVINV